MTRARFDSFVELRLRRFVAWIERGMSGLSETLRVKISTMVVMMLYLALLGLVVVGAGLIFDLEQKQKALIFVLGFYFAMPVGIFVLVVRSYLRNAAEEKQDQNFEGNSKHE